MEVNSYCFPVGNLQSFYYFEGFKFLFFVFMFIFLCSLGAYYVCSRIEASHYREREQIKFKKRFKYELLVGLIIRGCCHAVWASHLVTIKGSISSSLSLKIHKEIMNQINTQQSQFYCHNKNKESNKHSWLYPTDLLSLSYLQAVSSNTTSADKEVLYFLLKRSKYPYVDVKLKSKWLLYNRNNNVVSKTWDNCELPSKKYNK